MPLTQEDKQRLQNKLSYLIQRRKTEFDRAKKDRNYLRMDGLKKEMKLILEVSWDLELENGFVQYETMQSEIAKL